MKQMEDHRRAKQDEKKHDLEYFEEIRRQKEELAREEREKQEAIKQKVNEQKLIRDQQILEHNRLKNAARKEKRDDYERLKQIEYDLKEQAQKDKAMNKQQKEKVLTTYNTQVMQSH